MRMPKSSESNSEINRSPDAPSCDEQGKNDLFPIVGVGASAGGLDAFSQLLSALADDIGMAIVLVQHLDPKHESKLGDLLGKVTHLPVIEATQGLVVRPNHVYLIPPNATMTIAQGALQLVPRGESRSPHLAIDHFFKSLAEDRQAGAIGVIMSGTGSDGTLGAEQIKAAGGIVFAQDEQSATHASMPQSAVRGGCVDFVLAPKAIAVELARIGRHPYVSSSRTVNTGEPLVAQDGTFKKILRLLYASVGVDFGAYRETTVKRRIMRRMMLRRQESLPDYARLLEQDGAEIESLYQDILINVTSFFREAETFEVLKQSVFPEIVKTKDASTPIRVWVPGCATGEEAYSLAITLLEFLDDHPVRPPIQIFATDLSEAVSLRIAREGIYLKNIEAQVSPERLRRYFTKQDDKYRIIKSIRDITIFAKQNVATDPPISRLDLISCRNLLIYLSQTLQKRIIPTFHYALNSVGYLLLGSAETVGPFADLFGVVDPSHRIYVKKVQTSRQYPHFDTGRTAAARGDDNLPPSNATPTDWQREADRLLLGRYSPPGVLVNDNLDILQFRGETDPYLAHAPGEANLNLLRMAREGLLLELRSAIDECRQQHSPVRRPRVQVRGAERTREIGLLVLPVKLPGSAESCFMVLFEETHSAGGRDATPDDAVTMSDPRSGQAPASTAGWLGRWLSRLPPVGQSIASPPDERELVNLRLELTSTRDYLQSLIEQHDAANEELKSANEEILSSNEELQSTNEELETAKEELQSVNEELTTVNEQLQHRNQELSRLNDDLTNLLDSAGVPMLVLGIDLRIRRFTPAAAKVLNLLAGDVGRPVGGIRHVFDVNHMEAMLTEVIDTAQPQEREVSGQDGRWYVLRSYPYRTADHKIDGAVMVLQEITERRRLEQELKRYSEHLSDVDRRKDEFLAMLAHELRNPLTPIRNCVEILRRLDHPEAAAVRARDMIERQVLHMTRLIDDLVDVSRITSGRIELHKRRVNLAKVVESAVEMCRPLMDTAGHELTVLLPAEPLALEVDEFRLTQVVVNLLTNAAKYTAEKGHVRLTAGPEGSQVVLRVEDDGIGIAPEVLPQVFDLFMQGSPTLDRSRGGLGVGLTIVRRLVELHGGTVEAQSAGLGQGSAFCVRLPLAAEQSRDVAATTPSPTQPVTTSQTLAGRRILVVDDSLDIAETLETLLRLMGNDVRIAHDGLAALEMATVFRPEIICLDIGLPGMDGYEVARRIRKQLAFEKTLLIAVTGYGGEEDRRRVADAGFDGHIIKPVGSDSLADLVARLESANAPPRPPVVFGG